MGNMSKWTWRQINHIPPGTKTGPPPKGEDVNLSVIRLIAEIIIAFAKYRRGDLTGTRKTAAPHRMN